MARILFSQVADFTGGLNFRADQFQLLPNESPDMLNVEIDPRGGVFSRAGWKTKHDTAIVSAGSPWLPKGLFNYNHSTSPMIMLTTGAVDDATPNDGRVFWSDGGNFTKIQAVISAVTQDLPVYSLNGASMTCWGNELYMALGSSSPNNYKWEAGDATATKLNASGPTWQPYNAPVGGYSPRAELTIAHANKLFVANTYENGVAYPNRLRWSHENRPEDWFEDDYIDVIAGGEGIRGIYQIDGQLLIFKPKAIYLLMGYDIDSFQLVEITTNLGIDYPQQAVATRESVYFFDFPNGLYRYSRNGIQDLFERIRPILAKNEVNSSALSDITCTWINQRLWLSMPYGPIEEGTPPDYPSVNFIYDPTIGRAGAYTMFQGAPVMSDDATPVQIDGYGLVSGCEWRDDQDNPYYLMINPDPNFPYVYYVDDFSFDTDDVLVGATPSATGEFKSRYRTSWFDDNRYVQKKSFVRPYFVFKEVEDDTIVKLNVYKNFDESKVARTRNINLKGTAVGGKYNINNWDAVNSTYAEQGEGSAIKRKGISPLGRGFSVQLEFVGPNELTSDTAPGRAWGVSSVAYKFKRRKIRGN